uniref:Uncharacterized protein n=1 Tax=Pipistrellus kuhlii TaxID=59472 RepID=A0A7J7UTW6_PIPKU|nr:hypothetical protein mPipKuh1_008722 [Pipistrellus kuhlii]
MLETDRTFGLTHAHFKGLKVPLWGWVEGGHRMWPARRAFGTPSPLPARSESRPTTRKSPKGPPLSVAAGLLFAGHLCLIQEGGLTCQESLVVGVGGLKGVLWGGSSEPLQSLPQVGIGAPQGGLPRPRTHLNSVKQWMPICFHHARRLAKPLRRPPSVCYQL